MAWASVKGGKWHRIGAPITRDNFRNASVSECGLIFMALNSHDEAEPPKGWTNICKTCSKRAAVR